MCRARSRPISKRLRSTGSPCRHHDRRHCRRGARARCRPVGSHRQQLTRVRAMSDAPRTTSASRMDEAYLPFLRALAPRNPAGGLPARPASPRCGMRRRAPACPGRPAERRCTRSPRIRSTRHTGRSVFASTIPSPLAPCRHLVYFHGGGWALLDIDTHDRIMREYAAAVALGGRRRRLSAGAGNPVSRHRPGLSRPSCAHLLAFRSRLRQAAGARRQFVGCEPRAGRRACRARRGRRMRATRWSSTTASMTAARRAHPTTRFSGPPFTLTRERMAWFWDQYCPDPAAPPPPARVAAPCRSRRPAADPAGDDRASMSCATRTWPCWSASSRRATPSASTTIPNAPHAFLEALALHDEALDAIVQSAAWLNAIADR